MHMRFPCPFKDEIPNEETIQSTRSIGTTQQYPWNSTSEIFEASRGIYNANRGSLLDSHTTGCMNSASCVHSKFIQSLDVSRNIHANETRLDKTLCLSALKVNQQDAFLSSRLGGFEPSAMLTSPKERLDPASLYRHASDSMTADCSQLPVRQVRKRALSHLSDGFCSCHAGMRINYVETELKKLSACLESEDVSVNGFNSDRHDHKKVKSAGFAFYVPLVMQRNYELKQHSGCTEFVFQTDGPLLETADEKPLQLELCKKICVGQAIKSPPFYSMSPLGPKWCQRMNIDHSDFFLHRKTTEYVLSLLPKCQNFKDKVPQTCDESPMGGNSSNSTKKLHDSKRLRKDTTSKRPSDTTEGLQIGYKSSSASQLGIEPWRVHRAFSGLPTGRRLVGSFEESLLAGRFSFGKANKTIDGFLAILSVTGGSFSSSSWKIPFSVTSVDADSSQLYYASIDLAQKFSQAKSTRSKNEESQVAKGHFRIPVKGRIQLVISNPEMTPVHTLLCSYDLSDMPPGTKTFMRHKGTLASSDNILALQQDGLRKKSICYHEDKPNEGLEFQRKTGNVSSLMSRGCTYSESSKVYTEYSKGHSDIIMSSLESEQDNEINNVMRSHIEVHDLDGRSNSSHKQGILNGICTTLENCSKSCLTNRSVSKCKDGILVRGALRYALHLRFICPSLKNGSKKSVKIKESSLPSNLWNDLMIVEDRRRFYLYNDLRVVFPQRHSDADEGKLLVEDHFPEDPKYFEYSN